MSDSLSTRGIMLEPLEGRTLLSFQHGFVQDLHSSVSLDQQADLMCAAPAQSAPLNENLAIQASDFAPFAGFEQSEFVASGVNSFALRPMQETIVIAQGGTIEIAIISFDQGSVGLNKIDLSNPIRSDRNSRMMMPHRDSVPPPAREAAGSQSQSDDDRDYSAPAANDTYIVPVARVDPSNAVPQVLTGAAPGAASRSASAARAIMNEVRNTERVAPVTNPRLRLDDIVSASDQKTSPKAASSPQMAHASHAIDAASSIGWTSQLAAVQIGVQVTQAAGQWTRATLAAASVASGVVVGAANQAGQAVHDHRFTFVPLRSPAAWLDDAVASLADESASLPTLVSRMNTKTAWAVTAGVLAVDAAVLAYYHRANSRNRKKRMRAAASVFSAEPIRVRVRRARRDAVIA